MIKMAKIVGLTLIGVSFCFDSSYLHASPPNRQAPSIGFVEFDEEFSDPDGSSAYYLALHENISQREAVRRLTLMNEASRLRYKLNELYPDSFADIVAISKPSFQIVVHFSEPSKMGVGFNQVIAEASSPEMRSILKVAEAPRPAERTRQLAARIHNQMNVLGIDGTVAFDAVTGAIKLMVNYPELVEELIRQKRIDVPVDTRVEQFDGIALSEDIYGGYAYNGNNQGCTAGFIVANRPNREYYGVSTAGHCDNAATYNKNFSTDYYSWGRIELDFFQEWLNDGDVQWSTVPPQGTFLRSSFYNGSSVIDVTGAQNEYPGLWVCKFGRTTGQTCGYVDQYAYTDEYGVFSRVNSNSTYPIQNDFGDSGGPVFAGSLAVGLVHGKDSSGHMYFSPIRLWWDNLSIMVTCYC